MHGWKWSSRRRWLSAASLTVMLTTAGCESTVPEVAEAPEAALAVSLDGAFVAVPRATSTAQRQQVEQQLSGVVEDAGTHFYLAIKRSELNQKWFLSTFFKQAHPGGVLYGAGATLGTRVVSFQEQNGKLFVLDVDDRKKLSDLFDPQILVEAYPVVTDYGPFNRLRGSEQYVLVDPSAGLNRFGAVADLYAWSGRFQTELSFAQRFRPLSDGISFEQVFTGYSDLPDALASEFLEPNGYRLSGTLTLSLRRYKEGAGYSPTPMPTTPFYFEGAPRIITNSGAWQEVAAMKWNVHPGMKPIPWLITPSVLKLQNDPRFQGYDVVGAVKRGVENWNQAFGFKVLEARVGDAGLDFADDTKNVIIFDPDEGMPFAFANFRLNPNTSEIRGASVYLPAMWLVLGDEVFDSDPGAFAAQPKSAPPLRLSWSGMAGQTLCDLDLQQALGDRAAGIPSTLAVGDALTKKQKVEAYLTHVVLHEIGHTLGLRHNFAGSLVDDGSPTSVRSSSVMDYSLDDDAIQVTAPGAYDVQAVRYLYGMDSGLPTLPFCTDQDRATDPRCATYDRGSNPIQFRLYYFNDLAQRYLTTEQVASYFDAALSVRINKILDFVRVGPTASQLEAYQGILASVRPPLAIPQGAPAFYGARADDIALRVLSRLYLDPVRQRGVFSGDAPTTPALTAAIIADVRGILLNVDGVRGYRARRAMVDILKQHQTLPAYSALRESREVLTAQLPALAGDERLQTEDLLTRITGALSPYFR